MSSSLFKTIRKGWGEIYFTDAKKLTAMPRHLPDRFIVDIINNLSGVESARSPVGEKIKSQM